jgi:hypothetical protein
MSSAASSEFALHLRHQIEIDEPVPVNAGQRASERCLDGRETQIDVDFAPAAMDGTWAEVRVHVKKITGVMVQASSICALP